MKLKQGVEIMHLKKRYIDEVPDAIFKTMYGGLGENERESKKIFDRQKKKFEFVELKDEPVSNESKTASG